MDPDTRDNPYENVEQLPDWWRQTIEELAEYNLYTYQPPRFEDGILKEEVVRRLTDRLGVDIDFISFSADGHQRCSVRADNEPLGKIGRRRDPDGCTVYEMEAAEFEEWFLHSYTKI